MWSAPASREVCIHGRPDAVRNRPRSAVEMPGAGWEPPGRHPSDPHGGGRTRRRIARCGTAGRSPVDTSPAPAARDVHGTHLTAGRRCGVVHPVGSPGDNRHRHRHRRLGCRVRDGSGTVASAGRVAREGVDGAVPGDRRRTGARGRWTPARPVRRCGGDDRPVDRRLQRRWRQLGRDRARPRPPGPGLLLRPVGTGPSDPPTRTQTFATSAQTLHALLAAIGQQGPHVVVGHSYGGGEAVTFASRYRREVVGLVLLDATPPGWVAARLRGPR